MAKDEKQREIALEMAVEIAKVKYTAVRMNDQITTTKILADAAEFLVFLTE